MKAEQSWQAILHKIFNTTMKKISPPQNRKLKQSRIFPRVLTNPSTNCGTTLENTAWQWSQCKTKENFPELSCSFTTPENPPCLLSALAFTYPNISNGKKILWSVKRWNKQNHLSFLYSFAASLTSLKTWSTCRVSMSCFRRSRRLIMSSKTELSMDASCPSWSWLTVSLSAQTSSSACCSCKKN